MIYCLLGVAGVCPEGYYCENGTATPTGCPRGTFSNTTKLTAAVSTYRLDNISRYCLLGNFPLGSNSILTVCWPELFKNKKNAFS